MSTDLHSSAAERAEARRKRILEKSKRRLDYAAGSSKEVPSLAAPDSPTTSSSPHQPNGQSSQPFPVNMLSSLSPAHPTQNSTQLVTQQGRTLIIAIFAVILSILVAAGLDLRLSMVEMFLLAEAMLHSGSLADFVKGTQNNTSGLLGSFMRFVKGFRALNSVIYDFMIFVFAWMWSMRIARFVKELRT